jgi:hypothetical protein
MWPIPSKQDLCSHNSKPLLGSSPQKVKKGMVFSAQFMPMAAHLVNIVINLQIA